VYARSKAAILVLAPWFLGKRYGISLCGDSDEEPGQKGNIAF
jgi:hypothetical protein